MFAFCCCCSGPISLCLYDLYCVTDRGVAFTYNKEEHLQNSTCSCFFFFFCICVSVCVYVCFQTSTKSSKLFTFTLPWLSRSQTWSHGNTSTNQPLKLCPQPLIVACRVSRDDLIPVGFEKNQTTIRSVLHSQSNRGLCHGSQKQTGGGQRAVFCGGSWWCRVRSWGR